MTSLFAGAAGSEMLGSFGRQEAKPAGPEFYLWRQYTLRNGTAPRRLAEYFENAAIPALNRLGHSPIGVFTVFAGVPAPAMFVLTPLATLESLATLEARLDNVTVVEKQVPFRCTFTISAVASETDPAFDDAANDENNTTTVQLEVVDQNDLQK